MGIDISNVGFKTWLWSLVGVGALIRENKETDSFVNKKEERVKNPLLKQCLAKYRPPYRYVFTYYFLGKELLSPGERTRLFQKILTGLKWKKGVLFLPHNYIKGKNIVETPLEFWGMIEKLKKKNNPLSYILIFGEDSASCLVPNNKFRLGPFIWKQNKLLFLPSPEEMLPDNREVKNLVWHFLKRLPPP